jgi:type I restriction enzyme S subunit
VSWPLIELGDVCEIKVGKTPSRHNPEYWGEGEKWLSIRDMSQGSSIKKTKETITKKAIKETNIYLVTKGTVLFSFKLSIGKIGIAETDLYTNEAIAALPIIDESKLCKEYLVYALSCWKQGVKSHRAVMGATLNKAKLLKLKIPLPPLDQQKRLAAILDKADRVRRKRQQAIELADDFLRSVFWDMFGDPMTNPKGWEVKKLKEFTSITTGNTPSRKVLEFYGGELEWIKSDNINTPQHILSSATEFLSKEGEKVARTVDKGSTLITCIAGSFNCIGNAALADRKVSFNQQINALTPNVELVSEWFLYSLVLFSKKLIQNASTKSMKGMISKGKLEEVEMILPPLIKQQKFEELLKQQLALIDKMNNSSLESSLNFNALSQKAFSGEL